MGNHANFWRTVFNLKPLLSHLAHDPDHGACEEEDHASFAVELEVVVVNVNVLEDEELCDVLDQVGHESLRLLRPLEEELLARGENLELKIRRRGGAPPPLWIVSNCLRF